MVELLLSAGADPNVRNVSGISPLGKLLERSWSQDLGERIRIVSALLRAGASLDSCGRDGDNSFLTPERPVLEGSQLLARDRVRKRTLATSNRRQR